MAKPPKSKIYTRAGDRGKTTLISGRKVTKDHPRIAAYGAIDELNSALGTATSFIQDKKIAGIISDIQNELFNIGAELAGEGKLKRFQLEGSKIEKLELITDLYDQDLASLQTFILPAGSSAASF
jgi:cob(I)alamin adenosyltransferase